GGSIATALEGGGSATVLEGGADTIVAGGCAIVVGGAAATVVGGGTGGAGRCVHQTSPTRPRTTMLATIMLRDEPGAGLGVLGAISVLAVDSSMRRSRLVRAVVNVPV